MRPEAPYRAFLALGLLAFVLLGWMAASAARRKGRWRAGQWTAAALSVGLLPFESIPVLLACLGLRWWLARPS